MTLTKIYGLNAGYVVELYDKYLASPDSVDERTRAFFANWTPITEQTVEMPAAMVADVRKVTAIANYAQAIRQFGHVAAQLEPLGTPPIGDPELSAEYHGLTEADLYELPAGLIDSPLAMGANNAYEVIESLKAVYTTHIGYDNDHIRIPEERQWLKEVIESRRYQINATPEESVAILDRLSQIEAFEEFLQKSFPTKYRFSVEGLDTMIELLDELVRLADSTRQGKRTVAIAMAHRGRLNTLSHIMKKSYEEILQDFVDPEDENILGWQLGDVKYHQGRVHDMYGDGNFVLLMPPNPSHLEAINPIAVGMARAAGTMSNRRGVPTFDERSTMQILIHGDSAFPGQGIVAETFNLSRLPGYWVGGTIHIIANNQLGFTTLPKDARSTLYASDLAKGFKVPVVHVNADDPLSVIEVARLAFAYQEKFEKDFLIDLVGYRRYGHNELDEPGFTQPQMYKVVRNHPRIRQIWSEKLVKSGVITTTQADDIYNKHIATLQEAYDVVKVELRMQPPLEEPPRGIAKRVKTQVPMERLTSLNTALQELVTGFNFYSKRLENTVLARRKAFDNADEPLVDWATAEELAFASILEDGIAIRLTGQDSERGTFSHRHAVLYDSQTDESKTLVPLQELPQSKASFTVHNSPLSEMAVLGFEFGYNVVSPETLVLWEAQYGDFLNGAQNIVDEFIVSAREKWKQTPSLVMLLPHGHEGGGPDHSTGRPERFLQMAAKTNMRIANPTTAGQYFHLLRRQALLLKNDPLPLVVMSPKSLLRLPAVYSTVRELAEGKWHAVIDDPTAHPDEVTRLVFCSGKFYYDLMQSQYRAQHPEVAVVRVEQLYPFPAEEIMGMVKRYSKTTQIVWAQEEPKNMGAWDFMNYRIKKLVGKDLPVNYVGRRRSSTPAEGSKSLHYANQAMITQYAFDWKF
jgi:2-oxoglutarate dehydrogenase E1 component